MTTATTLAHHLAAFTTSVDAILEDYTPESILFTPNGPIRGLDGIGAFFADFLTNSPPALLQAIRLLRQDIDGEIAYIVWQAAPFIPLASDTFVIRDGKIVVQTFAAFVPAASEGAASTGA
jgi:hypothetical protein